ncbi:type 4a pilus biogenesis protein PilO [Legionella sp.]|uniref:type 4a pilus biogenesis protein PilO n=1 Tax=Legionella sp. TaxID=459 RepID=UPI003C965FA0
MNKINLNVIYLKHIVQFEMPAKTPVFVGACLLIIILGYCFIIQNSFTNYERLKAIEVTLKADFEKKQSQLVNLVEYRQQLQIINDRYTSMFKLLLIKNEMPYLLEELSKRGVDCGLKLELFAPQPEVAHDFYVELPIKISLIGSYFQLAVFLSQIGEMKQIVTIHEFSIQHVSSIDNQVVVPADKLVMNATAKIYRFSSS